MCGRLAGLPWSSRVYRRVTLWACRRSPYAGGMLPPDPPTAAVPLVDVLVARVGGDARDRARALALRLAAEVSGVPVERLRLGREASGRPFVSGAGVRVSLSHTRTAIAAAASTERAVGVDVEPLRPLAAGALARRWFPAGEAAWVCGWDAQRQATAFLWLWTQKEALAKAVGQGLGGGAGLLREVALPAAWPAAELTLTATPGPESLAVAAGTLDGLMVAIATTGPGAAAARVRLRELSQAPYGGSPRAREDPP